MNVNLGLHAHLLKVIGVAAVIECADNQHPKLDHSHHAQKTAGSLYS